MNNRLHPRRFLLRRWPKASHSVTRTETEQWRHRPTALIINTPTVWPQQIYVTVDSQLCTLNRAIFPNVIVEHMITAYSS